ncbi:probable aldehyde reductase [Serendipita indica DSM 11827]|uniref:Probable aldehyde reductase n=1 Tax=Serendipita indica (strain DSM 11827) TaxID=1109443 RepID=G4TV16_SERID|nr:probable aldehyde reductase [Serendipita indica DSM 11827]
MAVKVPTVKLNNGLEMPIIGLGTWQSPKDQVVAAVEYALKEGGYRHIDCAFAYGNEDAVGEGIRRSGVPREEIWVTSKAWPTYLNRVEECLDQTLSNLGLDYLDLYLIHWPIHLNPSGNNHLFPTLPNGVRDVIHDWPLSETWSQMESLVKKGKVRSIGVSNFSELKLNEILPTATIIPAVNQLELHVYNPQKKLLKFMEEKGIKPQAYSPLGSSKSPLMADETVVQIANAKGVEPSAVLLAYLVAKGITALPKSVTPQRIADNLSKTISVSFTPEEFEQLDTLAENGKQQRFIKPPWPVKLGFEDWI